MSHPSRRGSVTRHAQHSRNTHRSKQAGRQALEALESRIAPSTLVTLSAGTLGVMGDAGGGGEDESLVLSVSGTSLRISDPAHAIVAGFGTVQDGVHSVLAPLASLTDAVRVFTGGGHDSVAIEGAMPALHAFSIQSDDASSSIAIHGSISVHGADGNGGRLTLAAGSIENSGALDASGHSGGSVSIQAGAFLNSGRLSADGMTGPGGTVAVAFTKTLRQTGSGLLSARAGTQGTGGAITLLGSGEDATASVPPVRLGVPPSRRRGAWHSLNREFLPSRGPSGGTPVLPCRAPAATESFRLSEGVPPLTY
jgi:hypothetical protein